MQSQETNELSTPNASLGPAHCVVSDFDSGLSPNFAAHVRLFKALKDLRAGSTRTAEISRYIFGCVMALQGGPTKCLPENLIDQLVAKGAVRVGGKSVDPTIPDEDEEVTVLDFDFKSPAYHTYRAFCLPDGKEPEHPEEYGDPYYLPQLVYTGGVVAPPEQVFAVHIEVVNALLAYVNLRHPHFARGQQMPPIPLGPLPVLPPLGVPYYHATITAHAVLERIASGIGLPTIATLPSGRIITRINMDFFNAVVSIRVLKD